LLGIVPFAFAQNVKDSIVKDSVKVDFKSQLKFNYKQLIIPTVLITYGVVGIESDQLKFFNSEIKEEVNEHIDQRITVDDFAQYAPSVACLGLETLGIKGKTLLKIKQ